MTEYGHSPHERIGEFLQSELDETLRAVSYFSPKTEQIIYIREDLQEQYTRGEVREILNKILTDITDCGAFEQYFESILDANAMIFEDRVVTVLLVEVQEAIVISLDRNGDYSYLDLISACQSLIPP